MKYQSPGVKSSQESLRAISQDYVAAYRSYCNGTLMLSVLYTFWIVGVLTVFYLNQST